MIRDQAGGRSEIGKAQRNTVLLCAVFKVMC